MGAYYKICFLGYKKLSEMAQRVISELEYPDTLIFEKECTPETLSQAVGEARGEGCQVFIAGSANAAEFKRRFYEHLIELHIGLADYLLSLKRARERGAERVAIVVHRQSRKPDLELLRGLAGMPLQMLSYEDTEELTSALEHTDCDFVVGASLANEVAGRLNLGSTLIYEGEYTIRSSIGRARNLAVELRGASRKEILFNAVIRNTPTGIIITDENGRITVFNVPAKNLTGYQGVKIRGQLLSDVIPSLSYETFRKTGQAQTDQKHLIGGAMVRCVQTRLMDGSDPIGMLTTLQADNSRRKKVDSPQMFAAQYHWENVIGESAAMKKAVAEAKTLAELDDPVMVQGQAGTGKRFFAQCIHNGSHRAKEPYIVINTPTIARQDTARVLFGSEESSGSRPGLFEVAGSGTVVLQGLGGATESFHACLLQALTERHFFRVGGSAAIPFHAHLITLAAQEDRARIPEELWARLSVFTIKLPPLRERREDILPLFRSFLMQENNLVHHQIQKGMAEILRFYSWPTNLVSLSAVCRRYALTYRQAVNPSASARLLLLIHAIGEDELLQDIYKRYPALLDASNSPPEAVLEGVTVMKQMLKYNNAMISEKLGLSRTTLWRIQKNAGLEE